MPDPVDRNADSDGPSEPVLRARRFRPCRRDSQIRIVEKKLRRIYEKPLECRDVGEKPFQRAGVLRVRQPREDLTTDDTDNSDENQRPSPVFLYPCDPCDPWLNLLANSGAKCENREKYLGSPGDGERELGFNGCSRWPQQRLEPFCTICVDPCFVMTKPVPPTASCWTVSSHAAMGTPSKLWSCGTGRWC